MTDEAADAASRDTRRPLPTRDLPPAAAGNGVYSRRALLAAGTTLLSAATIAATPDGRPAHSAQPGGGMRTYGSPSPHEAQVQRRRAGHHQTHEG